MQLWSKVDLLLKASWCPKCLLLDSPHQKGKILHFRCHQLLPSLQQTMLMQQHGCNSKDCCASISTANPLLCVPRANVAAIPVLKPGNDGSTSCDAWCKSQAGGKQYSSCQSAYDTKAQQAISCTKLAGYFKSHPQQCYCSGLIWQGVWTGTTTTKTTTSKVNNCTLLHSACTTCGYQRLPGTRNTDFICSTCASGWRLRQDGIYKTCGEHALLPCRHVLVSSSRGSSKARSSSNA